MKESFQALGTLPTQMDKLNSWAIEGAILEAVDFNILDEIPSGPFDFEVSIVRRASRIPGPHSNKALLSDDPEERRSYPQFSAGCSYS